MVVKVTTATTTITAYQAGDLQLTVSEDACLLWSISDNRTIHVHINDLREILAELDKNPAEARDRPKAP